MKKELEKFVSEEVPPHLRGNILKGAHQILEREQAEAPGLWSWLLRPQFAMPAMAGALAIVAVILTSRQNNEAGLVPVSQTQYEAEMLLKADMLQDLQVFEHWDSLSKEQKKTWHKKKG